MEGEASARLLQAERAHGGEVAALDVRGGRLATAGGCGALRAWRWRPGAGWQPAGEARAAHRYGAAAVRWAAGGALLASGGVDGAARLWAAAGGALRPRRALAAPGAAALRALCWCGPSARLLAGHDDGAVRVWAAARGQLLARLAAHDASVRALAAPARGALLLSACTDGVLKVFDLVEVCGAGEGAAPRALQWEDGAHDLGALCAAASEGGAAATGGRDARIRVWRPAAGRLRPAGALLGHAAAVTALCWAGARLASASLDRTARLWAAGAGDGACLLVLPAHPRYLTCVALAPDLRYLVTGSNDKTFRMWSLGSFSLEDSLEPPCEALLHFALGDLEGIEPLREEDAGEGETPADGEEGGSGADCVVRVQAHAGPINCIATWDDLLATASSDSTVKVWRWTEDAEEGAVGGAVGGAGWGAEEGAGGGALEVVHVLEGHRYPVLAVDFGAGGAVLLSAGLDGCAFLWDVQAGVLLRTLVVPGAAGEGGGGVRGARVSPHRRAMLLLVTDDGLAALWGLTDPDPHPVRVYAEDAEAATCCAWSADGRVAALGTAAGELRLLAPPAPGALLRERRAHDLGVLSCDFAPAAAAAELLDGGHLLATAGGDSLVRLWSVAAAEGGAGARLRPVAQVAAHGGAVASVRWAGARLATAGADRWARAWRVRRGAAPAAAGAAPVRAAGGAGAAALAARGALLAAGDLAGELALWRLRAAPLADDDDDGAAPHFWGAAGVARWLRDYVTQAPGSRVSARARAGGLTGARLLREPVDELLAALGLGNDRVSEEGADGEKRKESEEGEGAGGDEESEERSEMRQRVRSELSWLRSAPPSLELERTAPHGLLCPISHRLLEEPARAADGYTYSRANLLEWLLACPPGGAVSPVSGRRLSSASVAPNYKLLDTLRAFLRSAPALASADEPDADDG